MVEVLAPAGSEEAFFAAVNAGADAVYLGLDTFSARKNAGNFTADKLPYFVRYAHLFGIKVYVALNIVVADGELEKFFEYASLCNDCGVDAIIIQEMLLGKTLREKFPDLPLHLSTQAGVNNVYGARLAEKYGFSRVVLARETPLEEIKKIADITDVEVFAQGALCTAFSGQCYLSGFAGNNSGNRGLCKQPCRKYYTLKNSNCSLSGYRLSLSDLCLAPEIDKIKDIGVKSLKIEGRMRKPSYVYAATKYYKDLLCGKNPPISPLLRTFNRGNYTLGLCFGQDEKLISYKVQSHVGEVIGKIKSINGKSFTLCGSYDFTVGDSGKILRGGEEVANFTIQKDNTAIFSGSAAVNDTVTLTTDVKYEKWVAEQKRNLKINVTIKLLPDEPPYAEADFDGTSVAVTGEFTVEKAKNAPLKKEDIEANFKKVGDLPFLPEIKVITENAFVVKSNLNELRRTLYEKLSEKLTEKPQRRNNHAVGSLAAQQHIGYDETNTAKRIAVIDDSFCGYDLKNISVAVFAPDDYGNAKLYENFFSRIKNCRAEKYLYLPPLLNDADIGLIAPFLKDFDGIYTEGFYGAELKNKLQTKLIFGSGTNIYNSIDALEARRISDEFVISKEATLQAAKNFADGYYYSAGSVKVMDLNYCPFMKDCLKCKGADYSVLSDDKRNMILRRVKLNGCRFELYNPYSLLTACTAKKQLFNFLTLQTKQKDAIIKNIACPIGAKEDFTEYTTGHSTKPLI